MDKDTKKGLQVLQMPNLDKLDEIDFLEDFKELFMDWLRFYRKNTNCAYGLWPYECSGACAMPDGCKELDRVWLLWLGTC